MIFYKKITFSVITGLVVAGLFSSCQEDLTTIGSGLIGGEPFEVNKAEYDVFAYNRKISAVKTNGLPIYQLGNFNDPVYGKTVASITSQLQLSTVNPAFGAKTQEAEDDAANLDENETIKEVYLYIPYLTNTKDTDGDGVPDDLDINASDLNSDTDEDGLTDYQESISGTNPLSADTDGDGVLDAVDTDNGVPAYPKKYVLDSIYGANLTTPFNLKVERSTYFLRDLDPAANFEQAQEYFSNKDFSAFATEELFNGQETIRDTEIVFTKDDPATEEVNPEEIVDQIIGAGIWVKLDNDFFQENILDREGEDELLNNINFKNFLRGIHISISESDDMFMLLNLAGANITVTYEYDAIDTNDTTDTSDDSNVVLENRYVINLVTGDGVTTAITGNAVNTFVNDTYPTEITSAMNATESAERIYLKGGAGSFAEIKLFDEDATIGQNVINQIKANNWIINEANLVFYVDRETVDASSGFIDPLRLFLYIKDTNQALYNPTTEPSITSPTALTAYPFYDGLLAKENGVGVKYKIRITDYINNLISGDAENVTLGLSVTSDIRVTSTGTAILDGTSEAKVPVMSTINPFGTVLYGNNIDALDINVNKKLKLEIAYTKVN